MSEQPLDDLEFESSEKQNTCEALDAFIRSMTPVPTSHVDVKEALQLFTALEHAYADESSFVTMKRSELISPIARRITSALNPCSRDMLIHNAGMLSMVFAPHLSWAAEYAYLFAQLGNDYYVNRFDDVLEFLEESDELHVNPADAEFIQGLRTARNTGVFPEA